MNKPKTLAPNSNFLQKIRVTRWYRIAKWVLLALLLLAAFYYLAFGMYDNRWKTVYDPEWFATWQMDSEQFVKDKILDSRANGISNYYGLTPGNFQQLGLQSQFFSLVDAVMGQPHNILNYLHFITSAFSAIMFLLIAIWFWKEFHPLAGIFVVWSTGISIWPTSSGRNLYWVIGTFLLPFVAMLYLYWSPKLANKKYTWLAAFLIAFATCFLRFGCGYEYTSAILVALEVPLIYYARKHRWGVKKYLFHAGVVGLGGLLAFATAFAINIGLVSAVLGSFAAAKDYMMLIISQRTGLFNVEMAEVFHQSLNIPLSVLFNSYLAGGPMPLLSYYRMSVFIYLFIFLCLLCWVDKKRFPSVAQNRRKLNSLNLAILVSFAGPFSWFILARGHTWIHRHITHILWSLPILPLIFGLLGAWLGLFARDAIPQIYKALKRWCTALRKPALPPSQKENHE